MIDLIKWPELDFKGQTVFFDCLPTPKPTMTHADRWKQRRCVIHYREYCDLLRTLAMKHRFRLGDAYRVIFYIPVSESWSMKKKREHVGLMHQETPDVDNLLKALNDSLRPGDDKRIWTCPPYKFWSWTPGIAIQNLI